MLTRPIGSAMIIAVLAGLLTACSSTVSGTPPHGSSGSTSSATSSGGPATRARLAALVLQPSDLPGGWTSNAFQPDPTDAANAARLAACVGVRNTRPDLVAEAHSPDYTMGDATISTQALSYRSQDDVNVDKGALQSPKASACFRQLAAGLATGLPAGTKIIAFHLTITGPAPGDPRNVVGHGATDATISTSGRTLTIYTAAVFVEGPFIQAELDFTNAGLPFPATEQAPLVALMAARVANA